MVKIKSMGNILGERTYYVVFDKLRKRKSHIYDYFLDKEFNHCFLLMAIDNHKTLVINPLHSHVCNIIINKNINNVIQSYLDIGCVKILKYDSDKLSLKNRRPRGFYTCVSFCKSVLNLWCWSITPKMLYKSLLKKGAIEF